MAEERKIISEGVSPVTSKSRRRKGLLSTVIIILIAVGILVAFKSAGNDDISLIRDYSVDTVRQGSIVSETEASGTVVYPTQVTIVSPREAYAEKLYAEEGQTVTTSDILAELDAPTLEDQKDDYEVQLEEQKLVLEELQLDYKYQIADIERGIKRLEEDVEEAEQDVAEKKELAELKSSRQSDYENAQDQLENLRDELEDARLDLEKTVQKKEIALATQRSRINQLELNLQQVQEDVEETRITSPIPGEVMLVNEDLSVPGGFIEQNTELFLIADKEKVFFDLEVYEQYIDQLEAGSDVSITVGTETHKAEIMQIGRVAAMSSDGVSAMVTVRAMPLDKVEPTMGASAIASIRLGVKNDALFLPRGAYLATGNQKYVYKVEDGKAYKTKVSFGLMQDNKVEITEGLEKGDVVITSSYSEFIDKDVIKLQED